MMTTTTNRTAARSAALASVKAIAITVGVVLAATLIFALLGSHIIPDFTGPFAQERYGEVVDAGGGVVQGAAEHASQLGEQADSIASGSGGDGESNTDAVPPEAPTPTTATAEAPLASPSGGQGPEQEQQGQEAEQPPAAPPTPQPQSSPDEEEEEAGATEAPGPDQQQQHAPDGCSGRPAGWPGCPDGSTQDSDEFIESQLETRPPTDPEEIAANAAAQGANGGSASRDEILARANAAKNPAPRDAAPPTASAGAVTRVVDGDTLAISGVLIDLSLVAAHTERQGDATRHTRQACPVGSTASYVPDTGRAAASPDGTQRAKVWCFGPDNSPAPKSLNQELAELGLAGVSAEWQACKGSSFYKEPWTKAIGC